jgi:predicted transposase/invertase (TIGR01784 family)
LSKKCSKDLAVGRQEGREVGRQEGREVGRQEGREMGRIETLGMVIHRLSSSGLSMAEIGKICNLTEEEIETFLREANQP